MREKLIKSLFDDGSIAICTRCVAEIALAKEKHPKLKYILN